MAVADELTLIVNAGSGSLKLTVLDATRTVVTETDADRWDGTNPAGPIAEILDRVRPTAISAVGHRVVHGGRRLTHPAIIDAIVLDELEALSELAPLHQPRTLAAIDAARGLLPQAVHVACFDTAFHTTMPDAATTFALPVAWRADPRVRRYGFHGLSHEWAATQGPRVAGLGAGRAARVVCCHLGSGVSACAIRDGMSVDTTMGFTPLDGLTMRTRPGAVDPGLLVWFLSNGMSLAELRDGLEHDSGLAGLAGGSGDIRDVWIALDRGEPQARLAFDHYIHRIHAGIGAMAAAAGGVDLLVLTGAIALHQPRMRAAIVGGLEHLGIHLDQGCNLELAAAEGTIHDHGVPVAVVESREDLAIAAGVDEARRRRQLSARHVVLVGPMGTGKTSVGKAVADRIHWPCVDIDRVICQRTGRTVADLWQSGGEGAYRPLERDATLHALEQLTPSVIAAPGGIVAERDALDALRDASHAVIYLRADPAILAPRLRADDQPRPLLGDDPLHTLEQLHAERDATYHQTAHNVIDVSIGSIAEIATEVVRRLDAISG